MKTKKPFDRKNSSRCIEYWTHRGYSPEEAKNKISEAQSKISKKQVGRKFSDETKKKLSKIHKKRNTLEYWIEKFGEEEGKVQYQKLKKKLSKNGKIGNDIRKQKNPNYREYSIRCKEYWMKRGFSEKEAIAMVSKNQTRSLAFFKKKYGEDLGLEKWEKKIKTWRKSFETNNDMNVINEKRRINSHVGMYTEETIKNIENLYFYTFIFVDVGGELCFKYGLTKHDSLEKRWSQELIYTTMFFETMESKKALSLEVELNNLFRHSYNPKVIKTTECALYNEKNITLLNETVQKHLENSE